MEFLADLGQLASMLDYIREGALQHHLSNADIHRLELASEEAIVNIINYAYPDHREGIWIEYQKLEKKFAVHIIDKGIAFNPVVTKPDIGRDLPIEERKIGGLGIYLIDQLMDEVNYTREGVKNHLTLYLYL